MCVLSQTCMPKETIETTTTKVVERTEEEDIIICDDCGMDESDCEINEFVSRSKYESNLFFCEDCLLKNSTSPANSHISLRDGFRQRKKSYDKKQFVLWCAVFLNPIIIGGIFGGFTGFFIGSLPLLPTLAIFSLVTND